MSNIVIEIKAPEISESLKLLAAAIEAVSVRKSANVLDSVAVSKPAPAAQPQMTTPVQQTLAAPAAVPPAYAYPAAPVTPPTPLQSVNPMPPQPLPSATTVTPVATGTPAPTPYPSKPAPVAPAPAFAYDDLANAASSLMDAGKQQQLIALLQQFQIQGLQYLPKERYGEFATALRQMGAKI